MARSRDWRLKREGEEEIASDDSNRWLITYADMITLLMVFFVVMYALSSRISAENFTALTNSLQKTLHAKPKPHQDIFAPLPAKIRAKVQMEAAQMRVMKAVAKFDGRSQVKVDLEPRGLVISLFDTTFFGPNSASVTPQLAGALNKIAAQIATMSNAISVEGHTDNTPVGKGKFTSNWDLAAKRAVSVVEYLAAKGHIKPERLSATTYAQYRPLFPNDSPEHQALNRRVDIVLSSKGPQPALTPTPTPESELAPSSPPANPFSNPFGNGISNPFGNY